MQEVECDGLEQQSIREELRKKLAQLHMEKFSAMATELSQTHQVRQQSGHLMSRKDANSPQ